MTRFEPGSVRAGRAVRGERVPAATGYSHRGTGRSIDDVRGRGREALAATRGATALALSPAVAPPRTRAQPAERTEPTQPAQPTQPTQPTRRPATAYERIRNAGPARQRVAEPEAETRPAMTVVPPLPVSAPRAPFVTLVLVVVIVGVLGILVINTKINEN